MVGTSATRPREPSSEPEPRDDGLIKRRRSAGSESEGLLCLEEAKRKPSPIGLRLDVNQKLIELIRSELVRGCAVGTMLRPPHTHTHTHTHTHAHTPRATFSREHPVGGVGREGSRRKAISCD